MIEIVFIIIFIVFLYLVAFFSHKPYRSEDDFLFITKQQWKMIIIYTLTFTAALFYKHRDNIVVFEAIIALVVIFNLKEWIEARRRIKEIDNELNELNKISENVLNELNELNKRGGEGQ